MQNCTPHAITVVDGATFEPGKALRLGEDGRIVGVVPAEECIVSAIVLDAWGWAYPQMRSPGQLVRDENGQPVGCRGLRAWDGDPATAALRCALSLDSALASWIECTISLVGLTDGQSAVRLQSRLVESGLPAAAVWEIWPPAAQDIAACVSDLCAARAYAALAKLCDTSLDIAHYVSCRLDCSDDDAWEHASAVWRALHSSPAHCPVCGCELSLGECRHHGFVGGGECAQ